MTVADLAHEWPVVGRWNDHPARALDRLGDEGRDRIRALEDDLALEEVRADPGALPRILRVRIAVEPRRIHMEASRQERLVGAAERGVAIHARTAKVRTVIALAQ